jgi:hypothetical protein
MGAVQAGERLHGLEAVQSAVHLQAAAQGLVEPGLEFVGHQQQPAFFAPAGFPDVPPEQVGVQAKAGLAEGFQNGRLVVHLAGGRHYGASFWIDRNPGRRPALRVLP